VNGLGKRNPSDGAASESNRPSVGLPHRTGFEDPLGHRAHAAPRQRLPVGEVEKGRPEKCRQGSTSPAKPFSTGRQGWMFPGGDTSLPAAMGGDALGAPVTWVGGVPPGCVRSRCLPLRTTPRGRGR